MFVIACTAAHPLCRITAYAAASIPAITKTAVDPGASFFAAPAVVPSATGAVVFAAAGLLVGAGVTLSPGGASVAVAFVGAAGRSGVMQASVLRDLPGRGGAGLGGRVFCGRDLLVMSDYPPLPSYRRFTGSPLELARHV